MLLLKFREHLVQPNKYWPVCIYVLSFHKALRLHKLWKHRISESIKIYKYYHKPFQKYIKSIYEHQEIMVKLLLYRLIKINKVFALLYVCK